jgi:hypothetical protein
MTGARLSLTAIFALALAGCSSLYRVVQLPQYEADLYPLTQTKAGVTIAVDEIRTTQRAERYFGADLIKDGILPVNVVVSNYSKHRVLVKPSDILLYQAKDIVDPLPLEMVVAAAKEHHSFLRLKTEEQVKRFFDSTAFKETVVAPNETYRGIIFFAAAPVKKTTSDHFFTMLASYREGGPKMRVGLTNLDASERVLFGPFMLTLPEASRNSWWASN